MKLPTLIFLLLLLQLSPVTGQPATYTVTKAPFSSDQYDEFSPVFYKNGIVFTTNRSRTSVSNISGADDKGQFKIFYIDTTGKVTWSRSRLFSKDLTSRLNDGPASFSSGGDTVYFSRNMRVEGNLSDLRGWKNNLGIFYAVFDGSSWTNIREFRFNNELYNYITPHLTSDGRRLYFASDKPGGFGGMDLYYCDWKKGYWADPVNLGPRINTSGNESYPFVNEAGELFFSSDGHKGLGGKDIYVTKQGPTGWYPPETIGEPVNSEFDDFGIVTDPLASSGYFSSAREKTTDIYHFSTKGFHFWFTETQKENNYCINIADTGSIEADTLKLKYLWTFGNDAWINGKSANYCFPGPGNYSVMLDLIDKKTEKLFLRKLSYNIDVLKLDQAYINSPAVILAGERVVLDGSESICAGYSIREYHWDTGDGSYSAGDKITHLFEKPGTYLIKLGVTLKSDLTGKLERRVVSKSIRIAADIIEQTRYNANGNPADRTIRPLSRADNFKINSSFSAEDNYRTASLFQVVLLTSAEKLLPVSRALKTLPSKYTLKEIHDENSGLYTYVIDQQMNLMETYPAFQDAIASGFMDAHVRSVVLTDPAEKDLYNIRKNYSLLTDVNFDISNRLTTSAYIMLDQIVTLMKKYPQLMLETSVHTDNAGNQSNNMTISLFRAQIIMNHLIERGVTAKRLSAKGYGDTRPVASNAFPTERRLNRRIEFTITAN